MGHGGFGLGLADKDWKVLLSLKMLLAGGESPRGCIDPLADLILILNKKYCDNLSRWLYQMMSVDGFPSPKATPDNKQHFVKMVLK